MLRKKRKHNKISEKLSVNDEHINNRIFLVGPSFSGKTYFMLRILSGMSYRDFYIITKSPPEQVSNSKIKFKEIREKIKPLNEYENAIIVFDDNLGTSSSKWIDQFFVRGRRNCFDIWYLSKSYFDWSKRTRRNNSIKKMLFTETLKGIENLYREVGVYDMSYDELKQLSRKNWEEE